MAEAPPIARDVRVGGTVLCGTPIGSSVAPSTLAETERLMRDAAAHGDTVAFFGGGTELGMGYAPERVDVLVRTERLARIVDYAPADMVVEVECGMRLRALQDALAPHNQRLALDVPHPELATLGGIVAAGSYGPLRTRFGSVRDLIVGVSLVRADGVRVRGGGKVVKNVAGFDLPRIVTGSFGSLGMIATATFRLHPLPETARALTVGTCSMDRVATIARAVRSDALEPAAFVATGDAGAYEVAVRFEGFGRGVDEQAERFAALVARTGAAVEIASDPNVTGARDEAVRTHGDVRLRIAMPPANLAALDGDVLAPLAGAFDRARRVVYPSLGIAFASGDLRDDRTAADAIGRARAAAERTGGHLVVLDAPASIAAAVDPYGTVPQAIDLMRRLKTRFDPERRLNRGRFVGRL